MEKLENDPLYQLLFSIKDQPWVFLGEKSLRALDNYVTGYLNACSALDPDCFTIRWYNAFFQNVCDAYRFDKEMYTIFGIIRDRGYGDADGLQVFFELLEAFAKEKYHLKNAAQPQSLQQGEVRAFRLDQARTVDFAGKYVQEHSEELFGISGSEGIDAYAFSLSLDNTLTCMVYRGFSPDLLSKTDRLPVFSVNDQIKYTVLLQGKN